MFRISVNLSQFFTDHRQFCKIFISDKMNTIKDLKLHISSIFKINNYHIMCNKDFLPDIEDVRVLQLDDTIYLIRNNTKDDCLALDLTNIIEPVPEIKIKKRKKKKHSIELIDDVQEKKKIKKSKKKHLFEPSACSSMQLQSTPMNSSNHQERKNQTDLEKKINYFETLQNGDMPCHSKSADNVKTKLNEILTIQKSKSASLCERSDNIKFYLENKNIVKPIDKLERKINIIKNIVTTPQNSFVHNAAQETVAPIENNTDVIVNENIQDEVALDKHKPVIVCQQNILIRHSLPTSPTIGNSHLKENDVRESATEVSINQTDNVTDCKMNVNDCIKTSNENDVTDKIEMNKTEQASCSSMNATCVTTMQTSFFGTTVPVVSPFLEPFESSMDSSDCIRNNTKRKRVRRRKTKQLLSTENSIIEIDSIYTPPNTEAKPLCHIKFDDDVNVDDSVVIINDSNTSLDKIVELGRGKSSEIRSDILCTSFNEENLEISTIADKIIPRENETVVFKILKIGDDYTPQLSKCIRGTVQTFNDSTGEVTLNITDGVEEFQSPQGKFAIDDEEPEYIQNLVWKDLVEPRIL